MRKFWSQSENTVKRIILIVCSVFFFFPHGFSAGPGIEVIHTDVSRLPVISVDVAVSHSKNDSLQQKDDYLLLFNDHQISDFSLKHQKNTAAASVIILIDSSFSLNKWKFQQIKAAAKKFINTLSKDDRASVYVFNDTLVNVCGFTSDKKRLHDSIDSLHRSGKYSLLYSSLLKVLDIVHQDRSPDKKAILLFSDGYDQYSKQSINAVIKKARDLYVPVYADGYTNINLRHLKSLKKLARQSGGAFAYQSNINIHEKIFAYKNDVVYQFSFEGADFQRTNNLVITNKRNNRVRKITIDLPENYMEQIAERKKINLLKMILFVLAFFVIIAFVFFLIKSLKKQKDKITIKNKLLRLPSRKKTLKNSIPGLKNLVAGFEKDIELYEKELVENRSFDKTNNDFDLFTDLFLISKGNTDFEINQVLKNIYELDSDTLTRLIPYMIHVVKDSNGFEKDINLNLLKEMAQNLNLSLDNEGDINHLEGWWNKNKEKAAEKVSSDNRIEQGGLLLPGFKKNENIILYYHENSQHFQCKASVIEGDYEALVFLSEKRLLLDTVLCFYKTGLNLGDSILSMDNYYFIRLHEISKEDEQFFQLKTHFLDSENIENVEIKNLTDQLFGE